MWLGNDANVAALAEQRFGAAKGVADVIYMTISTGIGGGIIVDNRLLAGREGTRGRGRSHDDRSKRATLQLRQHRLPRSVGQRSGNRP